MLVVKVGRAWRRLEQKRGISTKTSSIMLQRDSRGTVLTFLVRGRPAVEAEAIDSVALTELAASPLLVADELFLAR